MFTDELKNLQAELIAHPIYNAIETMDELHRFMRIHVFAVWNFMSLTKRLQDSLTCIRIPWIPPEDEASARLINDLVLNEESDVDRDGSSASHLTLYLKAMREVGAPTRMFDTFLNHLKQGDGIDESFEAARVPHYVREFVHSNLMLAKQGSSEEVAGNFLFGREDSIPKMFRALLARGEFLSRRRPVWSTTWSGTSSWTASNTDRL